MSGSNPIQGRTLYLIAVILAALALGLGLWDYQAAENEGSETALWGVIFPGALLILMLVLYFRNQRS